MASPERIESLQQSWVRLVARWGVAPAAAYPPFDLLAAAYSAADRHYHNLDHLFDMFRVAGRLAMAMDDTGPVQLAVWFHDAVYDTRAKDNEARSADLSVDLLGPLGVPADVLERVVRLIRATAHASADPPPDRDTGVLLDADLAVLGAAEPRYRQYAADIRREYGWVPDAAYRAGRAAVLERFLARPRLYWNTLTFEEGEARARENMRAELNELRAG
jgi:predicted metal-dependent HD superfamily phosphohydrolase